MKKRFEGPAGQRLLVEALKGQRLIEHDEALATTVATKGQVVEFAPGEELIQEGASDNDLLFIIRHGRGCAQE